MIQKDMTAPQTPLPNTDPSSSSVPSETPDTQPQDLTPPPEQVSDQMSPQNQGQIPPAQEQAQPAQETPLQVFQASLNGDSMEVPSTPAVPPQEAQMPTETPPQTPAAPQPPEQPKAEPTSPETPVIDNRKETALAYNLFGRLLKAARLMHQSRNPPYLPEAPEGETPEEQLRRLQRGEMTMEEEQEIRQLALGDVPYPPKNPIEQAALAYWHKHNF